MWGGYLTKLKNGFSGIGKSKVNSNNQIIPDLPFQQQRFKGGISKRFGEYNSITLEKEEKEVIFRDPVGKGAIYIHGANTPYYSGDIVYNKITERFSSTFSQIDYPVFSDCIIFKRISTDKSQVGRIYGSHPNGRVRDYYPMKIPQGMCYIKRFEYQSITKSSLDQETKYRRDKNYYSKVFEELYEKGRPVEFEKVLCCRKCGQYYYTGSLMPEEKSPCIALTKDGSGKYKGTVKEEMAGKFYTIDSRERKVTNPLHTQYVDAEEFDNYKKGYKIIRFTELDITKYDYDYRILYYPKIRFPSYYIYQYQGALQGKKCSARYGITRDGSPITVEEFSQKNNFFYSSYANFMYQVCNWAQNFSKQAQCSVELTKKIQQTTRHYEKYVWEHASWHTSAGTNYMSDPSATNWNGFAFISGNKTKQAYGAYYTDEGDAVNKTCNFGIQGGTLHGGAEYGYSTGMSYAHRGKAFSSVDLKYHDNSAPLYSYEFEPAPGEFIFDPLSSENDPLSEQDLNDNNITPKDESNTVNEEKEETTNYQWSGDPFEILYVSNFSKNDVDLQMYTPHVFTNILEYEEISPTSEKLMSKSDSNLQYCTMVTMQKTSGGGASKGSSFGGSQASGYIYIDGLDITSYQNNMMYYKQKYVTKNTSSGPKDFAAGAEEVRYTEIPEYYPYNDRLKYNDLFFSPYYGGNGVGSYTGSGAGKYLSGKQFKEVNQRLATSLAKYSFLAVGASTGWAGSVFNKYIFLKCLPSNEWEEDIDTDKPDHSEIDGANGFNTDNMPPLFRPMTESEIEEMKRRYRRYFPSASYTFLVSRPAGKLSCLSADKDFKDSDWGGGPFCHFKGSVSYGRRSINTEGPWKLVDSGVHPKNHYYYPGWKWEQYKIVFDDEEYGFGAYDNGLPYGVYTTVNDPYNGYNGNGNERVERDKHKTLTEFSPVFKDADIPGYYYQAFSNLDQVSSSYAEYMMLVTREKGKLLTAYNANPRIQRPWAGNITTVAGCCPIRAKNKYFIFDSSRYPDSYQTISKKPWAPISNTPDMQNRFFGSGATYVNYLGEGVYPHPDGDKFILVSSWFTDIDDGFSGIELKFNDGFTNFAKGKCSTGFNLPCDSALIATYNIAGPLISASNLFSKDNATSKYTTNKGVFPIIKGLWQPDKDSKGMKNIEHVLFMIETQCMIEGPEYFFSTSRSELPAGFEKSYQGYKSRGLIAAVKYKGKDEHEYYPLNSEVIGFYKYFKPQNTKRDKINFRRAFDPMPRAMTKKTGYYYDCEEAFGLYEVSSPYAYETQLAAKMSFTVRIGDNTAVLFMFAYDIDKWPANIDSDNPTNDKQFAKIYKDEEYKFKTAYLSTIIDANGVKAQDAFNSFEMQYSLRDLTTRRSKSDRSLENEGYEYFKKDKQTYYGIIVPKDSTSKKGYKLLPQYIYDNKKDNKVQRGIARLVRWRTMTWECPKTSDDYKIIYNKDDEVTLEKYEGAIAQIAISFNKPLNEYVDQYYVGQTVLVLFYRKVGSNKVNVENLFIPKQMIWLEDKTNEEEILTDTHTYNKKLINIASLGMIDTIIIKKKNSTTKSNKYSNLFTSRKDKDEEATFEILGIPVISTDNQTYLAVTKDCKFWEIAGKVGSGKQVHLTAEFMENKENE